MFDLFYRGQKSGDLKELLDHLGPTQWPGSHHVVLSSGAMGALQRYEQALEMLKNPNYLNIPGMGGDCGTRKEVRPTFSS